MIDKLPHSKLSSDNEFYGLNVCVNYSKEYYLSGEDLILNINFTRSNVQKPISELNCISLYIYGIASFSSKILSSESESKEYETSFSRECITFPFLISELNTIGTTERLRLIYTTDAYLLEPHIKDECFVDKKYQLKVRLPPFLPPSFNGQFTRVKYVTCISANQQNGESFKRAYQQFPFVILGSISAKLPILDRYYMPIRSKISDCDSEDYVNDDIYLKIYDWWLLMNEDCGFDYDNIGSANFTKFIYNFILEGVEAAELYNKLDFNSDSLLDYEALVEQRKRERVKSNFLVLKIGSGGISLCSIKLYGTGESLYVDMENTLVMKLNSALKMDFEFFSEKYSLKMVQVSITCHEVYPLDLDKLSKAGESSHKSSFPTIHCLDKVIVPPFKKIYSKTLLKRFIYCSSYDSTSIELYIPRIEPSFVWNDIAFYYRLNFYFHIADSINNLEMDDGNRVQLLPFKYKTSSYTVDVVLTP